MPSLSTVSNQDESSAKSVSPGADDGKGMQKGGAAKGKRKKGIPMEDESSDHESEGSDDEFKSEKAAAVSNLFKPASKSTTKAQQKIKRPPKKKKKKSRPTGPLTKAEPLGKETSSTRVIDGMLNDAANNDDECQYLESSIATPKKYVLVEAGANRFAKWWQHYCLLCQVNHPNTSEIAICKLCNKEISIRNGSGGLSGHLQYKHRDEYDELLSLNGPRNCSSPEGVSKQTSILGFVKKMKGIEMMKKVFLALATFWVIDQAVSFATIGKKSFRAMFKPFHDDADKIIAAANEKSVREHVYRLGKLGRRATLLELKQFKGSWTCDHWAGPNDETFTVTTFHYIEDFVLKSCIIDFKVHRGRTRGEDIFEDQKKVLDEYIDKDSVVLGVTDTTGNMGKLGEYLRDHGYEHAYCTDHNFHRNALLAFLGKFI